MMSSQKQTSTTIKQSFIGHVLMSIGIIGLAFGGVLDVGVTHSANPLWLPHARFHFIWAFLLQGCLGSVALYYLWCYRQRQVAIQIVGLIGLCLIGSYYLAIATTSLYGGSLAIDVGHPVSINIVLVGLHVLVSLSFLLGWRMACVGVAKVKIFSNDQ